MDDIRRKVISFLQIIEEKSIEKYGVSAEEKLKQLKNSEQFQRIWKMVEKRMEIEKKIKIKKKKNEDEEEKKNNEVENWFNKVGKLDPMLAAAVNHKKEANEVKA